MEISGCCLPPHCRCQGRCCPAAAPRGYQAPASPGLQRVGGGNGQSRANPGGHGLCWAMEDKRTRPGDGAGTGGRGQRALQDPNTPHLLRFTNDPPISRSTTNWLSSQRDKHIVCLQPSSLDLLGPAGSPASGFTYKDSRYSNARSAPHRLLGEIWGEQSRIAC